MSDTLYSLKELTDSIVEEYKLEYGDNDMEENYLQRITRALKSNGFWDNAIIRINPNTKRKTRYFTEGQRQSILAEKTLFNYVRDHSSSRDIRDSKRYDEYSRAIETRREEHMSFLGSLQDDFDDEKLSDNEKNLPYLRSSEYKLYKVNMMLSALFELYFTPINDSLLFNDVQRVLKFKDDLNLTVEDIQAEDRLDHPEGIYYNRRTKEDNDDKVKGEEKASGATVNYFRL